MGIVDYIVKGKKMPQSPIPAAVFTLPEVAMVGISEEEALAKGMKYKVGRFPYAAGSRANAVEEKYGLVKIIANEKNRLVGAHIIGAEAAEMMPILTHAVSCGMKPEDFKEIIFIHPTLSENIWEAVGVISNHAIHI
jgi:dihydrolipoamide dehydrogenase